MRGGYSFALRLSDRCIGVALCFLFSLWHAIRPKPKAGEIRNVLIIELFEMGASVMAYSSLQHIRRQLPSATIYCLCLESTKAPWLLLDVIKPENVFAINNRSTLSLAFSLLRQTRALSRKNIDV